MSDIVAALLLATALTVSGAGDARADGSVYVVVNAASPVRSLTQRDVVALYTGRTRAFPDNTPAQPLDYPRDSDARRQFYLLLTGQDLPMINSYWSRLLFSGQLQPPRSVDDERAMRAALRDQPSAIGYLARKPEDPSLRVVLTVSVDSLPK